MVCPNADGAEARQRLCSVARHSLSGADKAVYHNVIDYCKTKEAEEPKATEEVTTVNGKSAA